MMGNGDQDMRSLPRWNIIDSPITMSPTQSDNWAAALARRTFLYLRSGPAILEISQTLHQEIHLFCTTTLGQDQSYLHYY